jgi:hypothetical protein
VVNGKPVGLKVPVLGSYNSTAELTAEVPRMRTRPSGSKLAVWYADAVPIEPVGVNVPPLADGLAEPELQAPLPTLKTIANAARAARVLT